MAYDEILTQRFRKALARRRGITDKRMMGGICFLKNGNMIGAADRNKQGLGRFMFRVGKQNEARALRRKGAYVMEHGGRRMGGFIFVNEDDCNDAQLRAWIDLALEYVGSLPAK